MTTCTISLKDHQETVDAARALVEDSRAADNCFQSYKANIQNILRTSTMFQGGKITERQLTYLQDMVKTYKRSKEVNARFEAEGINFDAIELLDDINEFCKPYSSKQNGGITSLRGHVTKAAKIIADRTYFHSGTLCSAAVLLEYVAEKGADTRELQSRLDDLMKKTDVPAVFIED